MDSETVEIVNENPAITFDFHQNLLDNSENKSYALVALNYDGWLAKSVPEHVWDQIIAYCNTMKSL